MRCLVTGGLGFIGSHLCERLLDDGHEVVCLDNLATNRLDNLKLLELRKNFTFANVDITHALKVDTWMNGVDIVYHQAASKKNVCLQDPSRDLEVNGNGTLILLETAKRHGVKKFVHASTGSVYGEPRQFPQTESHPLDPCSYYGVSKLAGDRYVRLYDQMGWLNTVILRYFHVYGPRQDDDAEKGGVVAIFLKNALNNDPLTIYGNGTQVRSFTYVDDIVNLNILAKEGVYNCASGIRITVQELAEKIIAITGSKSEIIYKDWLTGDIMNFDVDNTRARELITFTDFETGIEKLIHQEMRV